jgi:hypothetical protein
MVNVFLSYRREDSAGYTGRLHDRFIERWGQSRVFWDLDTIEPGDDFVEVIDRTLAQCAVMVAVIGPRWLTATDAAGRRRIDQPSDYHRIEIERALQRRIRIIPTLVGGAHMPTENELPESLYALARRNAVEVSDKRFNYDAEMLADAVDRILANAQGAAEVQAQAQPKPLDEKTSHGERASDAQPRQELTAASTVPPRIHPAVWLLVVAVIAISSAVIVRTSTQPNRAEPVKATAPAQNEAAHAPKEVPKRVTGLEEDSSAATPRADTAPPPSAASAAARKGAAEQVSKAGTPRERPQGPSGSKRSARCSDLLNRLQLGEALSADDQALFQKECQR